jgi:hypothetical protein
VSDVSGREILDKILEELATAIYDEVCRVFNKETGGNQQTHCPLSEQSEAVRKAYFRGAVVANTLVFNRLVNRSIHRDD